MISKPKFVKKANQYVVTEWNDEPNDKGHIQKQYWFKNFLEAQKMVNNE